jgi:hypothetical protein
MACDRDVAPHERRIGYHGLARGAPYAMCYPLFAIRLVYSSGSLLILLLG